MKISTKGRYALRMMICLAENGKEKNISTRELSAMIHVNTKYLEQIAGQLAKTGLVRVMRGSSGGYRLSRKPEEYPVLEIIEAVEGSLAPVDCLETQENYCEYADECPTLAFWTEFYGVIREFFGNKTLKDFLGKTEIRTADICANGN